MLKLIRSLMLAALVLSPAVAIAKVSAPHPLLAASAQATNVCTGVGAASGQSGCDGGKGLGVNFKTIANTLIFLVGAIAVIMIIIGGLRYVLASGDSAALKSAKDTVLYALIGVAVSLLAYALVSYIASRFA